MAANSSDVKAYEDFRDRFTEVNVQQVTQATSSTASYQQIIRHYRSIITFSEDGTDLKKAATKFKNDLKFVMSPSGDVVQYVVLTSRHEVDAAQLNQYLAAAYRAALAGYITHDMLQGLLRDESGHQLAVQKGDHSEIANAVRAAYSRFHAADLASLKSISAFKQEAKNLAISSSDSTQYDILTNRRQPPAEAESLTSSMQKSAHSPMPTEVISLAEVERNKV